MPATSSIISDPAAKSSTDTVAQDDPDAPGAPISVPDSGDHEGGKLKMIIQLVKRSLGVKDLAAMRISLPASLMEPVPNLEYWGYLDRPDLFAAINEHEDPLERMLSVLRFTFSKDLKFIKGKVCKPYNSVLGEHFRAYYDVPINAITFKSKDSRQPPEFSWHLDDSDQPDSHITTLSTPAIRVKSPSSASLSVKSIKAPNMLSDHHYAESSPNLPQRPASSAESSYAASTIDGDDTPDTQPSSHTRVLFLTEQVSHHPPISSFKIACPDKGVEACGVDQIAARVTGTALKVHPGTHNKGIFVNITKGHGEGETYWITHPTACVNGILRGSFYATITDSTIITCTGGKGDQLRAIIEYKEEPWLGAPRFLVEGVIYKYTPGPEQEAWTKVKQVPKDLVVATFDGCWRKSINWKKNGGDESTLLIDLSALSVVPKQVRPIEEQLPNESRRLWEGVTSNLLSKEFSEATKIKQAIEQKQRDIAAERKRNNTPFEPVYFDPDISSGAPQLTAEGQKALEEMIKYTMPKHHAA
ncbi:Oxysterol-binding protein-like protein 1 [Serendipita indica DSM 11827]|uniref:Related to putative oxysterol-binding protein OSBP n=1 Tax=Serendipita indica (strain DSM 11827) TaxID=1109443 RepID=G4TIP3_SERID|nr:Oxysterol-binding protein-like protein 1 [Serendipita indica DSM 11827]CCA71186.1 related to putative oxysterol-binding protein OSBP [Serendipita indica DSM 11827]